MIQVAVHTALVTAVSDVQVCAERDAQLQSPGVKLLHQRGGHKPLSVSAGEGLAGPFVSKRRPRSASSLTRRSASARATSGSTSNSAQTLPLTISQRGVAPSADFQISEATSFSVNSVESVPDIITISRPSVRAPTIGLRVMYSFFMKSNSTPSYWPRTPP